MLAGGATALLRAGSQQGASASGGDLAIMLVTDVYNKAEWEIRGGDDDTEGRARKSEFDQQWDPWPFSLPFFFVCLILLVVMVWGQMLIDLTFPSWDEKQSASLSFCVNSRRRNRRGNATFRK